MFEFYFFSVFLIVAIFEGNLSENWNSWYFRRGLRVYRKTYSLPRGVKFDAQKIQNNWIRDGWDRDLIFRDITPNQIAFREEIKYFIRNAYTPIMRGFITNELPSAGFTFSNSGETKVNVIGYLNWSLVALALYILNLTILAGGCGLVFVLILSVILFVSYRIQANRFNNVGEALTTLK